MDTLQYVKHKIDNEGFDYTFLHYSVFKQVKDETFHKLRKKYIKAYDNLNNYILDKTEETED